MQSRANTRRMYALNPRCVKNGKAKVSNRFIQIVIISYALLGIERVNTPEQESLGQMPCGDMLSSGVRQPWESASPAPGESWKHDSQRPNLSQPSSTYIDYIITQSSIINNTSNKFGPIKSFSFRIWAYSLKDAEAQCGKGCDFENQTTL